MNVEVDRPTSVVYAEESYVISVTVIVPLVVVGNREAANVYEDVYVLEDVVLTRPIVSVARTVLPLEYCIL